MPEVMRRFEKDNTFRTTTQTLRRPDQYKAKRFIARTWHNPYTEPDKVQQEKTRIKYESLFTYDQIWHGNERRQGWWDLREEAILLKGTVCAIQRPGCESQGKPLHPSEVIVDHIIPRAKFKDPTEADRMENLQILCTPCNRAKTKADLKVLRRMR
jgi:5-methylcytosine-specific restriction endonuclease McrA